MSDSQFELTRGQKELLLRGLRFVRSSVALDMSDYSEEMASRRETQYEEIGRLQELLENVPVAETAPV